MPPITAAGTIPAEGAHEVIIESARHVDRSSALSAPEFGEVLASLFAHDCNIGTMRTVPVRPRVQERRPAGRCIVRSSAQSATGACRQLPPTVAAEHARAAASLRPARNGVPIAA